ncbi:MAG: Tn3 family transposase [Alteromonadaceae bacterium]|nr:Tn3 family transposase [Alteromonadaceae bacterium]
MKNRGKRLSILSLPEVKEFYSVPIFNAQEREYFFTFTDAELDIVKRFHSHRNRIHFLLMLGYFKVKSVCLIYNWKDIEADYQYISMRYFPNASKQRKNISRLVRSRLYKRLLDIGDHQRFNKAADEISVHLEQRARLYVDETQLFKDTIILLKSKHMAIPGYSTLQQLISKAINTEEKRLAELTSKYLTNKHQFLKLIDSNEKDCRLITLKKLTKTYKPGEISKELKRHQTLSDLSVDAQELIDKLNVSEGNIRYFATRCQQYNINRLRELKQEKALIYLTCFIVTRLQISKDSLAQSFLVSCKTFNNRSTTYRDEKVQQLAQSLMNDIQKVPEILNLFIDGKIEDDASFGVIRDKAFEIISKKQLPLVSQQLAKVKPDKSFFQWEYVDNHFGQVIKTIRPLIKALDLGCRGNALLEKQIESTKNALNEKEVRPKMDGRLVKRSDKKHLASDGGDEENSDKRIANRNEMYLYQLLYKGINNGDVYVKNSIEYRSFDEYLVNDKIWKQRKKHLFEAGLDWMNQSCDDHLSELKEILNEKLFTVGMRISEGKNSFIKRKSNSDKLRWTKAVSPKDDVLTEKFFAHFNRKTIVNVLRKVNDETGFLDHFTPESKRHKKSANSIENLLAVIIGNGTFQGTHKFATISDQQYKVLKRIEDDYFHGDALRQANDSITSAAMRLSIFDDLKLDDGETHGSADGQRFESKHGNPLVGHSAKHFGKKKGGIIYSLVASHFATQGKVISARSHESHHLFDIVYNNTSDLKAKIISTDNHGINQFNHAILNAFGYQFTPRYAQFKKRFLDEFKIDINDGDILSFAKPINWKLIKSEWDNIVKIMLSLGMRTVQQCTLVKKLCSYKQRNTTMLALAEYNRILKCLHLLDYADDKQLRQVIQESLNRGEQLQGLKRALAALGGNQFRGTNPEEMAKWNGCANLLANSIVYYNAFIMASFKSYCLEIGADEQIIQLQSVSPASWENVILNGYYDLSDNDEHWDIQSEIENISLAS